MHVSKNENKEQRMKTKKILAFVMVMCVFTVFSFAGIEWFATMKTVTQKGKNANNDIVFHTYAQAGNVKQVFEGVSKENPFYFQDGYWLYRANEDIIYIVNDKKHEYMVFSMDELLQLTGMLGQLVKIRIEDQTVNTEVLPDEKLLGYPCTHLKITTEYTMKMKIAFIKQTMMIYEEKEIWGTTNVPGLQEIHKGFMEKQYKTGFPGLDELIAKQMEQQKKIGFPLKTITHTIQKDKKGKVKGESTDTMTVTKIESKNIPASFFEVPANYTKTEGPAGMKKSGIF
jgi:hypothetical protein